MTSLPAPVPLRAPRVAAAVTLGRVTRDPGDREPVAFDVRAAYRDHGSALLGFAVNAIGDRAAAEDCVQETFLRAWRSRSSYRADVASTRTWLFAIARNVVVDAHRTRSRRPVLVEDDHLERAGPTHNDAAQVTDRIALTAGLAQLAPEHREVIVAVQIEGIGYAELAERTGVPIGTLRSRMFYGLKALKDRIGEEGDHGTDH